MTYIHTTKAMYNHILHRYVDKSLQKVRLLVLALLTLAILNKTNLTLSENNQIASYTIMSIV